MVFSIHGQREIRAGALADGELGAAVVFFRDIRQRVFDVLHQPLDGDFRLAGFAFQAFQQDVGKDAVPQRFHFRCQLRVGTGGDEISTCGTRQLRHCPTVFHATQGQQCAAGFAGVYDDENLLRFDGAERLRQFNRRKAPKLHPNY